VSVAGERALEIIESSLSSGVTRGERAVSFVRILASVLVFASMMAADGPAALLALHPRPTISTAVLMLAAAASIWVLARSRAKALSPLTLLLSVTVDAMTVFVAIAPTVVWTREAYPGVLHMPAFYFFPFVIALSGLRLERALVHWSVFINLLGAAGIYALDMAFNGPTPLAGPADYYIAVALFLASISLGYAIAGRTRELVWDGAGAVLRAERARMALGVYVSEEVADQAMAEDGALQLGGERRQVAVLFSDLRGFTAYSDKLAPERLVTELNDYLDRMVEVIRAEGGVVDKYIGDAIMVVFGIPEARPDDALRAVRCAAAMQAALDAHNVERTRQNLPSLKQGIGVHYGPAIAGNIGSADRLQYTVMGSVVNEASRLESATKTEGVSVLISASTVAAIEGGDLRLQKHGVLALRGAAEPVEVYTLS